MSTESDRIAALEKSNKALKKQVLEVTEKVETMDALEKKFKKLITRFNTLQTSFENEDMTSKKATKGKPGEKKPQNKYQHWNKCWKDNTELMTKITVETGILKKDTLREIKKKISKENPNISAASYGNKIGTTTWKIVSDAHKENIEKVRETLRASNEEFLNCKPEKLVKLINENAAAKSQKNTTLALSSSSSGSDSEDSDNLKSKLKDAKEKKEKKKVLASDEDTSEEPVKKEKKKDKKPVESSSSESEKEVKKGKDKKGGKGGKSNLADLLNDNSSESEEPKKPKKKDTKEIKDDKEEGNSTSSSSSQ